MLSMRNSSLFGPSCKFGKCQASVGVYKSIALVCPSDVRAYLHIECDPISNQCLDTHAGARYGLSTCDRITEAGC